MLQEKVLRVCKKCGVIQEKIQFGKYNSKDKRWRDANGQLWAGNLCPVCHRERMREYQKARRAKTPSPGA